MADQHLAEGNQQGRVWEAQPALPRSASALNGQVLLAGVIAGLVLVAIQAIYEAVAGSGFWAPLVFMAAIFQRDLPHASAPAPFLAGPVLLGLVMYLLISSLLAVLFAAVTRNMVRISDLVTTSVLYGLGVFALAWFVVLPAINPVMLRLNGLIFALAHLAWGAALGLLVGRRLVSREEYGRTT